MTDQKFTVTPGDEIVITVPRKHPSGNELLMHRPSASKGMIRARRTADFLPRRLSKKGLLNFIDTGQTRSGANWITRQRAFFNDVDIQPYFQNNITEQVGWTFSQDVPTLAQFQALAQGILADGITGREIKKSNSNVCSLIVYGFSGSISSPENQFVYQSNQQNDAWTEDGLKLTADQLASEKMIFGDSNGYCTGFGFYEGNKITTAPSFDAEPVTNFRLDAGAQIHLTPTLRDLRGFSTLHTDGTHDILTTFGQVWRLKPRFFDEPNAVLETNSGQIEAYERAVSTGAYRAFTHEFYFASPYIRSGVSTGGAFNTADNHFQIEYGNTAVPPVGSLVGIIKQKGQTFYFWQLAA